jgi:hypothetical protein
MNTIPRVAGRAAGTIARSLIWAYHEIDWAEVAQLMLDCLTALAILTLLAGRACRRAWDGLPGMSEVLGRWYSRLLVPVVPAPAPAIPAIHPLAVLAADLEQLSCCRLREILNTRRRPAKRELIATALWVAT